VLELFSKGIMSRIWLEWSASGCCATAGRLAATSKKNKMQIEHLKMIKL
jgi:hypothetical protein